MQDLDRSDREDCLPAKGAEPALCVIIAAHNEEAYIGSCIVALLHQDIAAGSVEVIIAANACTDRTEEVASRYTAQFASRGWALNVLSIKAPGKLNAFNHADRVATGRARIYLDADVICAPELLGQLCRALDRPEPTYATGTLNVTRAQSWITRAYANLWVRLPFVQDGAVGAGLFAVNAVGRQRWGNFPAIISDDTFVRLNFAAEERIEVPALYYWPMVEGFRNLVRVRRRQDTGVAEVKRLYPNLMQNDTKPTLSTREAFRLFMTAPVGFVIYVAVHIAVRTRSSGAEWTRGR